MAPLAELYSQTNYSTPYLITTLAGNAPYGAVDGVGGAARFLSPNGVALDASGNLFVADTGVLAQPSLSVFDNSGKVIASNTVWGTNANPSQISSAAAYVGAFPLALGSADSAQIVSLSPGSYTMQISGANSTTGVALAEVYEVP
jgi:hypothetical protein